MPKFTTRVELHDADGSDYDILHSAMEDQGFSREITADDGKVYRLPTAEYDIVTDLTRGQVLAKAKSAADTTSKSYSIIVTQSVGRTWSGLPIV